MHWCKFIFHYCVPLKNCFKDLLGLISVDTFTCWASMFLLGVVSQGSVFFTCGQMKTEVFEYDVVKHQSNIIHY